jgi:hypothetical protein
MIFAQNVSPCIIRRDSRAENNMNFDFCQVDSGEKYQLRDMHERPVFVRKLNDFERLMHPNCVDCVI